MAGWIKMPLDMKVGLNPGHIVLDGDPKGHSLPQFFAHVCCGQTAGWIKMPLGMEVDLGGGHTVRWGPTPAPKVAQPLFGPCLLWPNGRPSQLLVSTCLHFGSSVISLEWQLLVFNFVQNHDFSEIKLWRRLINKNDTTELHKKATRSMVERKSLSYLNRLAELGLTTLKTSGGWIKVFTIFKGFVSVDYLKFFQWSNTSLCGHSYKLFKPQVGCDIVFFHDSHWYSNSLPDELLQCEQWIILRLNLTFFWKKNEIQISFTFPPSLQLHL